MADLPAVPLLGSCWARKDTAPPFRAPGPRDRFGPHGYENPYAWACGASTSGDPDDLGLCPHHQQQILGRVVADA